MSVTHTEMDALPSEVRSKILALEFQLGEMERKLAEARAERDHWREARRQCMEQAETLITTLEAQLAEARAALESFDAIGQWLFVRGDLPDDTVMVTFGGINGSEWVLTRGDFKRASTAIRALRDPEN